MQEFKTEEAAVIKAVGEATPKTAEKAALGAISATAWHKFYMWLYSGVMKEFALQTFKSYREVKANDELDEEYLTEAEEFMEETVSMREGEVLQTTRDRLRRAILAVLALGGGNEEIQAEIAKLYKHDIPIRSRAIAQTEVITAGNAGTNFAALTVGANRKEWIAVMDNRTRDSHREVDGEIKKIEERYSNGLRFPGDPEGPAAEVINCRCVEAYLLT